MNWITEEIQGATFGGGKSVRQISKDSPMQEIDDHRYTLWHRFEEGAPLSEMVAFIGLNPSTAVPGDLDRTVGKCEHYAKTWGFKGFVMLNLFSYRATYPEDMIEQGREANGDPENYKAIRHICIHADTVIACWGNDGKHLARSKDIKYSLRAAGSKYLHALAINATGEPKHPLYHRKSVKLSELVKL